ncbi:MAG: type II toxin-antitoxin system RelE/ParE family toxin [Agathobacter sp.]|nr:type II toxin-antitoxin system RelE/ParE family toxin [Agathobacter sp.]
MGNKYEIKVTRQALEQMREIAHYISYDLMAPEAADNLLDDLKASILKLSVLPKKYPLIEEEPWRSEGVRKIVVKNFLVYYWIDEEYNKVQVTAVIYSKRDQIKQLKNMEMN